MALPRSWCKVQIQGIRKPHVFSGIETVPSLFANIRPVFRDIRLTAFACITIASVMRSCCTKNEEEPLIWRLTAGVNGRSVTPAPYEGDDGECLCRAAESSANSS